MNLKKIIREETENWKKWIEDISPSLLNTVITFEPMITEEQYEEVLKFLELDENLHTNTGNIRTLQPFNSYDYLHHLLIDKNGRTVFGGTDYDEDSKYQERNQDIDEYLKTFTDRFENPMRIDGRNYFNL